jgi:hypothetical protein
MAIREFFIRQKASFCLFGSFLSAAKRPSGQSAAFYWLESVRLPDGKFFIGQTAPFYPAKNPALLGKRRFARSKIHLRPESVPLPDKKSKTAQKASFWPLLPFFSQVDSTN